MIHHVCMLGVISHVTLYFLTGCSMDNSYKIFEMYITWGYLSSFKEFWFTCKGFDMQHGKYFAKCLLSVFSEICIVTNNINLFYFSFSIAATTTQKFEQLHCSQEMAKHRSRKWISLFCMQAATDWYVSNICKVKNTILPKHRLHFCNKFIEREGSTQLFLQSGMILS